MIGIILGGILRAIASTVAFPLLIGTRFAFEFGNQEPVYCRRRFWFAFILFSLELAILMTVFGQYSVMTTNIKGRIELAKQERLMEMNPKDLSIAFPGVHICAGVEPTKTLFPLQQGNLHGGHYLKEVRGRIVYSVSSGNHTGPRVAKDEFRIYYDSLYSQGKATLVKSIWWLDGKKSDYWEFHLPGSESIPVTWYPDP